MAPPEEQQQAQLRQQQQQLQTQETHQQQQQSGTEDGKPQRKWWRITRKVLGFVLAQWLLIGFGIACLLGYLFPRTYCTMLMSDSRD